MNKKLLSIGLLCLLAINSVFSKDIYVSKNGNDNNAGTQAAPYRTVSKAAAVAVAGDNVYIGGGSYEETLKPSNSGVNGNPITFQSIPGEKVIITAMQALSGFTLDAGAIYKTTTDWDMGQQNFVMHNHTALDLARWPNNTDGDPYTMDAKRNDGGSGQNDINAYLTYNAGLGKDLAGNTIDWSKGGSIHFYGDRPGSGWICWRAFITASTATRVDFGLDKNPSWIRTFHEPSGKGEFFMQGVKQALDYQNEWYFDPATKTLYVQLPSGAKPADGSIQMRKRVLTVDLDQRSDIVIKNIAVFGGEIRINGNRNKLQGLTSLYGNHTLGVIDNGFSSGNQSVDIRGNDNLIEKCDIGEGAGSGVFDRAVRTIIRNSYIHGFCTLGNYDAILNTRGGDGGKYLNNIITKGGRDAIQGSANNAEYGYNDVSFSNLMADDCALFYVTGGPHNSEIHHNWFHDAYSHGSKSKAAGIYLDNDSHSFSVHHNVIWNTEWTAFQINWSGTNIDIFNNSVAKNQSPMGAWHKAGTAFSDVRVWNNIADKDGSSAGGQETEATWEPQADKQNNLVDAASYTNLAANDFTLKAGAKAIDFGRVINESLYGIGTPFDYTAGYVGAKPDAGAYEYGKPAWKPGIDWDIAKGPTNTCYGLPGETCSEVITPIVEAISFVNAPLSVTSSNQYTFNVNYAANEARDVIVEIKTAADVWVGRTRVSVAKGTGTTAVVVNLANALPIANGYKLSTWLVPTGLDWQAIIVSKNAVFNVEAPVVEAIKLVNTPTELKQGKVFTFDFTYTSAESRNVIVEVKNSANTWLGNVKVLVPKGTGTSSGTITFANNLPIATGYKLSAFMVPTGLDWKSTIVADNAVFKVVLVTGLESNDELENVFYPNPTTGLIHFGKELEVEVYNNLGNKLFESISSDVDLSNQAAGVYFLKVESKIYRVVKY